MIPQIVVIDDDPIILKRAWNTLTSAGLKVVALKSGKALLEYIKDNSAPDLILMDISMPEMDGFETVKALKFTTFFIHCGVFIKDDWHL